MYKLKSINLDDNYNHILDLVIEFMEKIYSTWKLKINALWNSTEVPEEREKHRDMILILKNELRTTVYSPIRKLPANKRGMNHDLKKNNID